ncbi:hypothetical protein M0657_011998 [Pyricularia oryzae]|nr:hypothetical protein M9X92_011909 [Pyricularia oryzae]KAI7909083.1 hypothetical protein M0657_011998 [Pyricularia oryzae]
MGSCYGLGITARSTKSTSPISLSDFTADTRPIKSSTAKQPRGAVQLASLQNMWR